MHSVDWDGEKPGKAAEDAWKGLRKKGVKEVVVTISRGSSRRRDRGYLSLTTSIVTKG